MMHTIKATADIDRLFKEGRRGTSKLVLVLSLPTPESRDLPGGRVLFVAGKKLGNAVLRNRCKRVLREACRRMGGPWPGADAALVARPGLATAPAARIEADLRDALQRAQVTQ